MAGASRPLLALLLVAPVLAGCVGPSAVVESGVALNRHIELRVEGRDLEGWSDLGPGETPDVYDVLTSTFVVSVQGQTLAPSELAIQYRDRAGRDVNRTLDEFTTKPVLLPGDAVRIEDAALESDAVVWKGGVPVADRRVADAVWWDVAGAPLGFSMDPGAVLAYEIAGGISEEASVADVRFKDMPLHLDEVVGSFALRYGVNGRQVFTAPEEVVTANASHEARPLEWSFDGELTMPMFLALEGTNTETNEPVEAGVEVKDLRGDLEVSGRLWIAERSPVLFELDGGTVSFHPGETLAWSHGVPEFDDAFECAGTRRTDGCRLADPPFEAFEEDIRAEREALDVVPEEAPPEVVANLTRFLAEDLRAGDEIVIVFDVEPQDVPSLSHLYGSGDGEFLWEARIRATGVEEVATKAGRFDGLKVVETVRLKTKVPAIDDGGLAFDGLEVDQTLLEASMWFDPETFVPLRMDFTIPFDVGKVVGGVLDGLDEGVWDGAPIEPVGAEDMRFVAEARMNLELVERAGTARFSPWMTILGTQYASGAPVFAAATAYVWTSDFGTEASIQKFPMVMLSDAEAPLSEDVDAVAVLEHRGGDDIHLDDYTWRTYLGRNVPYAATFATNADCLDATPVPAGPFAVGDRLYVCEGDAAPVEAGAQLVVQVIDERRQSIVYESDVTLA